MCAANTMEIFFFFGGCLCVKMLFICLKLDLNFDPTGIQVPNIFSVFRDFLYVFTELCQKGIYRWK